MSYKTKKLISNILLFLESILLFLIIVLFVFKVSFNKGTIINKMDKTNYYQMVYDETLDNMKYVSKKSNISVEVLNDIFNIEDIKRDSKKFVGQIFDNKNVEVNTDTLIENIQDNLDSYDISDSQKDTYVKKIASTYKNEVRLMNSFNDMSNDMNKYFSLSSTLLILFIVDLAVLIVINKMVLGVKEFYILCFSSSLALIGFNIFISSFINKLFIYNNQVSDVLKLVFRKGIHINVLFIIILLVLGFVFKYFIREENEEIYE